MVLAWLVLMLALAAVGCRPPAPTATPGPDRTALPAGTSTATPIPTSTTLPGCTWADNFIQALCTDADTDLDYLAYVPSDTSAASDAGLPLLVYLHGSNLIGSDLGLLRTGGVPTEIEKGRTLPMLVVSPQCPYGENWQTAKMVDRLSRLVNDVVTAWHIDPARVYLTGFSMGGDGVWALGKAHPEQFAALAPVSSDWYTRNPEEMCVLRDLPIRVFQSQADEVVSPKYAQQNLAQVQACGGSRIELTLFPSGSHEATARQVYAMDELYQWFLGQEK